MALPIQFNTSTRTRTRNAPLEAGSDLRFTTEAKQRKARDSNPYLPCGRAALAVRSGQPYPATFRNRRARETARRSVDPPGIEPGFPACRAGVVPLDHEPTSGASGNRTPIAWVQTKRLPVGPTPRCFLREVRPEIEVRPSSLPRTRAAETPTDRRVIPDGVEPSLSCVSCRRLRRWTTGSTVTRVGVEPTNTRLSTSPLCQFAYPVGGGFGGRTRRAGLMRPR